MSPKKTLFLSMVLLPWMFACSSDGRDRATDPSRFMEMRGTEFYLDGKPFYEISYNKFDLFWQLLQAVMNNTQSEFDITESFEAAERALSELHELGFKTIRTFGSEHSCNAYRNPEKRDLYYKTIDRMLDLCDKYDIRVVFSLGSATFCVEGETGYDAVANPLSESRKFMDEYLRTIITRYRDRATIAMWEVQNELLLDANIGGREGIWNGRKVPTLTQVKEFHGHVASLIRSIDKRHLITTGDGVRSTLWHQYQFCEKGNDDVDMWDLDTWSRNSFIVSQVQNEVDVYGFHAYYQGKQGFGMIVDDNSGERRQQTLSEWKAEAARNNSAFYLGEFGALAVSRERNPAMFAENPDWFTSFVDDRERAIAVTRRALGLVTEAGIQLTHYWTYSSDRNQDKNDPQRMDVTVTRNPELVSLVVEANRKLQMENMGFTYMK